MIYCKSQAGRGIIGCCWKGLNQEFLPSCRPFIIQNFKHIIPNTNYEWTFKMGNN